MPASLPASIRLTELKKCPACKTARPEATRYALDHFSVYCCPKCSLEYIDPSLDSESMMYIYTSSETLKAINPALENYYEYETLKEGSLTWKDYCQALDQAALIAPGKELLEVGCGTGGFLKFARSRGWQVSGIDSSAVNIAAVKKEGMGGICSDYLQAPATEKFDVIVLWDLIEHPQDPMAFVRKSAELLNPGGILLLATPCYPNLLSLLANAFYVMSSGTIKGPAEKMYMLEHTTYFGPENLSSLLKQGGFRIEKYWRTETDLARYSFPFVTRAILHISFFIARLLGLQNRLIMLARKS